MRRRWRAVAGAALIVAIFALIFGSVARAEPAVDEARSTGEQVLPLVAPVGPFRLGESTSDRIRLELEGASGQVVGILELLRGPPDHAHRFRSRSFAMEVFNLSPAPGIVDTLVHAAWAVAKHDDGAWALPSLAQSRGVPAWQVEATLGSVAIAALLAFVRGARVSWEVRLPHLLPAAIQVAVFAYWSLYWPPVREHAPSLLLELVMGFAADAAFSFVSFGSWRVGASPLPIVLSANLFAWFFTPGIVVLIVVAFASKTFIRRGGRHVLNPSAAGLSVGGLCAALAPDVFHFGGVFHTMNTAPNLAELIVVLSLAPQLRFRIVPVSMGAVLALWAAGNPAVLRPAVLLAVVLLATDPATIPRTDVGKLLFGAFVGLGLVAVSAFLRSRAIPDDFSKVMPIPVANALVPQFDALGARIAAVARQVADRFAPRAALEAWTRRVRAGGSLAFLSSNRTLVACWLALVIPNLGHGKVNDFEPALYWTWGTPLVTRDADDVPRCAANPVFCKPFTFVREAMLWRAGGASRGPAPPGEPDAL